MINLYLTKIHALSAGKHAIKLQQDFNVQQPFYRDDNNVLTKKSKKKESGEKNVHVLKLFIKVVTNTFWHVSHLLKDFAVGLELILLTKHLPGA